MTLIKVKPPYKPLVQLPYCCGCCAFLWVLHRRGYWIDQEEIAWYCKVKIPKKEAKSFIRKMRIAKSKKDRGTSPEKMYIYLNKMLKDKKIPLKVERYSISKIKNPKEFIIKNLKDKNDIMLSFSCKPFPKYGISLGHVCVIAEFDSGDDVLTLGDPAQSQPKFWKVSLEKVIKAMNREYDGHERGFLVLNSNNKFKN